MRGRCACGAEAPSKWVQPVRKCCAGGGRAEQQSLCVRQRAGAALRQALGAQGAGRRGSSAMPVLGLLPHQEQPQGVHHTDPMLQVRAGL